MSNYILNTNKDIETAHVVYTLANSCMPTLLGRKPSSLINFQKKYIRCFQKLDCLLEQEIDCFDCQYKLLYENENAYFVLVYNADLLEATVLNRRNALILGCYDYRCDILNLEALLGHFKLRFSKYHNGALDFPDELGIFLGYPIEDVEQYIKNKGQNYKLCGYWKVYDNVEKAQKTFEFFKYIRKEAVELILSGKELSEMNTWFTHKIECSV